MIMPKNLHPLVIGHQKPPQNIAMVQPQSQQHLIFTRINSEGGLQVPKHSSE